MSAKTRLWTLGAGIVSAALILFGVVGGLLPQLAIASSTDDLAESAQIRNDAQVLQIAMLTDAEKRRTELESTVAELEASLPATAASAQLLRELDQLALDNGVQLTTVTASTPAPPEPDPNAVPEDAAAPPEGVEAANADEPVTAPAAGLLTIPISVVAEGQPDALANFVRQVQLGQRLVIMQQIDIAESGEGVSSATITGFIFIAPK